MPDNMCALALSVIESHSQQFLQALTLRNLNFLNLNNWKGSSSLVIKLFNRETRHIEVWERNSTIPIGNSAHIGRQCCKK